jgi:mRNA interferase MazF
MSQDVPQGSVWMTEMEDGGPRPCIVVTRASLNFGESVLVVPCSSSDVPRRARFPNNVLLREGEGGMTRDSVAMTHLAQPVEVTAFRTRMGQLDDGALTRVLQGIAWSVDLLEFA